MALSFVTRTTTDNSSAFSPVGTYPSGVQAGDFLLFVAAGQAGLPTAVTGFTNIGSVGSIWYRIADGSEVGGNTINTLNGSVGADATVVVAVYRAIDGAKFDTVGPGYNNSGFNTNHISDAITPNKTGWTVSVCAVYTEATPVSAWTPDSGYTADVADYDRFPILIQHKATTGGVLIPNVFATTDQVAKTVALPLQIYEELTHAGGLFLGECF